MISGSVLMFSTEFGKNIGYLKISEILSQILKKVSENYLNQNKTSRGKRTKILGATVLSLWILTEAKKNRLE